MNVSDEMKSDDERLKSDEPERGEELCSSLSDTTEELHSSSEPDTYGDGFNVFPQKPDSVINVKVEFDKVCDVITGEIMGKIIKETIHAKGNDIGIYITNFEN